MSIFEKQPASTSLRQTVKMARPYLATAGLLSAVVLGVSSLQTDTPKDPFGLTEMPIAAPEAASAKAAKVLIGNVATGVLDGLEEGGIDANIPSNLRIKVSQIRMDLQTQNSVSQSLYEAGFQQAIHGHWDLDALEGYASAWHAIGEYELAEAAQSHPSIRIDAQENWATLTMPQVYQDQALGDLHIATVQGAKLIDGNNLDQNPVALAEAVANEIGLSQAGPLGYEQDTAVALMSDTSIELDLLAGPTAPESAEAFEVMLRQISAETDEMLGAAADEPDDALNGPQ